MRSRPDNGKNVRRKRHCAVRYCVNYNVSSPCCLSVVRTALDRTFCFKVLHDRNRLSFERDFGFHVSRTVVSGPAARGRRRRVELGRRQGAVRRRVGSQGPGGGRGRGALPAALQRLRAALQGGHQAHCRGIASSTPIARRS